jgi:hypothetical protein
MIPKNYRLGRQRFVECLISPLGSDALRLFDASSQRRTPRSSLALMLGFAVVLWGVQYKLSLYCCEATHRTIPAAKLLSESERPISSVQLEGLLAAGRPLSIIVRQSFSNASIALLAAERPVAAYQSTRMPREVDQNASRFLHMVSSNPRAPPIPIGLPNRLSLNN